MCTGLTEYPVCQLTEDLTEARVTRAQGVWKLVPKHNLFSNNNNNDNNKNRVTQEIPVLYVIAGAIGPTGN